MKYNFKSALWLCFFIFIAFLLQKLIVGFTDFFILDVKLAFFRPWALLSAVFLHSGVPHLFYNLFALALFGSILEHIIGTKKFLILFFISGLIASIASMPFYTRVLGASGAIFGILGMLALLRPKMIVWIYSVPMPMILALLVWAAGDVLGIFVPGDTANIAHLAGLGVGIIAGIYYKKDFAEKKAKEKEIFIDEEKVREWERSF